MGRCWLRACSHRGKKPSWVYMNSRTVCHISFFEKMHKLFSIRLLETWHYIIVVFYHWNIELDQQINDFALLHWPFLMTRKLRDEYSLFYGYQFKRLANTICKREFYSKCNTIENAKLMLLPLYSFIWRRFHWCRRKKVTLE